MSLTKNQAGHPSKGRGVIYLEEERQDPLPQGRAGHWEELTALQGVGVEGFKLWSSGQDSRVGLR